MKALVGDTLVSVNRLSRASEQPSGGGRALTVGRVCGPRSLGRPVLGGGPARAACVCEPVSWKPGPWGPGPEPGCVVSWLPCVSVHTPFAHILEPVLTLGSFSEFLFYQYYMLCVLCVNSCFVLQWILFVLLESTCMRESGRWGGAEGDREPPADFLLSVEPSVGLKAATLRS